ncbi:copper resistance CopC family protein [Streptomyces sp. H51]|uniref:copper resistance CopC family protein n=1 Tax=Streptomyces sp. H51 TaxID=3111770 RepID=UPI002D7651D2|nr:copper resistance CopC family protein [Streptomyces sp. H51]
MPLVLAVVLLAVVSVLWPAAPAWAHARLLDSSPAAGSVTAKAPTVITLSFDGPVKQPYTAVVVTGPDGASYGDGAPSVVDGDVRQKVGPLPTGRIQVTWRTVAADGAPLQGRFAFTSTDAAAAAAARPGPTPTPAATVPSAASTPTASAPSSSSARPVASTGSGAAADWPWWVAGGVLVAAAAAFMAVGARRSAPRSTTRPTDRRP